MSAICSVDTKLEFKLDFDFEIPCEILREYESGIVEPRRADVFRAFEMVGCADNVKAVILGQDPYHNGVADGLAFSVGKTTALPPSLKNIFRELYDDVGVTRTCGDLSDWARQGVLLLNTVLTVRAGEPGSHKGMWGDFTDAVISQLSDKGNVVFILWGAAAKTKARLIDDATNLILTGSHPSPLSVNQKNADFFGGRYFSKTNDFLQSRGIKQICW